jgi:Monooxygenase af470-like
VVAGGHGHARIMAELRAHPESGCLASTARLGLMIQYWRSFDHLEAYARNPSHAHWPAWTRFNRRVRTTSGDVGIWHETFLVRAGEYETLYGSMPRVGLALAGRHLPVNPARETARLRIGRPAGP